MRKFEGQALAIVMIVLVIASIIGLSMFSRVLRDNQRIVSEQTSAEALEIVNSALNAVKGIPLTKIEEVCANAIYGGGVDSEDGCGTKGINEVAGFLTELGVTADTQSGFESCTEGNSTIEINIQLADGEDDLELRPDMVRSVVLRGQVPDPVTCVMNVSGENRGSDVSGLLISTIYGSTYDAQGVPTVLKPYAYGDTLPYCITSAGMDCSADARFSSGWNHVQSGDPIVSIPLGPSGGYNLDELRFRAVGGIVGLNLSVSPAGCIENWQMIKITVGANCTGTFRAKEVQIPQEEGALQLFDYVLFNGTGILQPE